jgi:tol-pal system protein YbgF
MPRSPASKAFALALVLSGALWLGGRSNAQETAAAQTELRFQQLEDQVRTLTGQIETQNHQIEVLNQQIEKMRGDTELRLTDLEAKAGAGASVPGAESAAPVAAASPAGAPTPLIPAAPPRILGTVPSGSVAVPPAAAAQAAAAAAAAAAVTPDGRYQEAYALIGQGKFAEAERAFRGFLTEFPKDPLASSAAYWLGHSYYARGDFENAAIAQADGYKKYPKGNKAQESLLELGKSLDRLGNSKDACATYGQLDKQFGATMNPMVKHQAQQEKTRLKCG